MERIGSNAMKSLAAYADSDEEGEESSKESGEGIDSDYNVQRLDSGHRHRTLSNVEIANAQLPEAPDSYGEEGEGSDKGGRAKSMDYDDDDDSAEFRRLPLISADDEYDTGDSHLIEPPPPARPRTFQSPSPSSSRGSTPQIVKMLSAVSMPRLPSSQALVSYQAEDDDEIHQRISIEKSEEQSKIMLKVKTNERKGTDQSRPSSDGSQKSEATIDDIEVDEMLEKRLESSGNVDSPGEATSVDSIQIPPEPTQKCSEELQAKFRQYLLKKRRDGYNFNAVIQNRTDFRNPSIYEKLIEHFGIDEVGTNFPKRVFDPHGFKASDYYEEIGKAQRLLMEKGTDKEKQKAIPALSGVTEEKKRKTKWDN